MDSEGSSAICFWYLQVKPGSVISAAQRKICIGSTFQSVSTTSWMLLCIAACRRKLRGTWSTVAHKFQKSTTLSQSTTPYCAAVLSTELVQSPVLLCGTLYRIVSVTQHRVLTVFGNYLTWSYLQVIKHTKRSRDASWEIDFIPRSILRLDYSIKSKLYKIKTKN